MSDQRPEGPAPAPQYPGHPGQQFSGQPYPPGAYPPGAYPPGPYPGYPPAPHPPKKSSTGLIIGLVVGALVLGVAGVGALYLVGRSAQTRPVTANTAGDFNAVCTGGSITNAADFTSPYLVKAFVKRGTDIGHGGVFLRHDSWTSLGNAFEAGPGGGRQVDYTVPSRVNAVACLTEVDGARTKARTCTFRNTTADYYATRYTVALHEAKTGRKVRDLGEVPGSGDSCPFLATVRDGRVLASPDRAPLQHLLADFTG